MKTTAVFGFALVYLASITASLPANGVAIVPLDIRTGQMMKRQADNNLPADAPRPIFVPANNTNSVLQRRNLQPIRVPFMPRKRIIWD